MSSLTLDGRLTILERRYPHGTRQRLKELAGFVPVLSSQAHRIQLGYVQYNLDATGDDPLYDMITIKEYLLPLETQVTKWVPKPGSKTGEIMTLNGESTEWGEWTDANAQRDMLYLASVTTHIHTFYDYVNQKDWYFLREPQPLYVYKLSLVFILTLVTSVKDKPALQNSIFITIPMTIMPC